jgi:hypothetical protein
MTFVLEFAKLHEYDSGYFYLKLMQSRNNFLGKIYSVEVALFENSNFGPRPDIVSFAFAQLKYISFYAVITSFIVMLFYKFLVNPLCGKSLVKELFSLFKYVGVTVHCL